MSTSIMRPFSVPDRPLGYLALTDGAFAIMRTNPRSVASIVALFVIPTQLLTSWLQRETLAALSFDNVDWETGTFDDGSGGTADLGFAAGGPIATVVPWVVLPFLGVALTHLVEGWRQGEERSVWTCIRFTLVRTHLILAAFVLGKLLQVFTILLAMPITMLIAPVMAAERLGPVRAIRRANKLARPRYGSLVLLLLLLVLVSSLLSSALSTLPVLGAFFLSDWGWVAFFALSLVSTAALNVLGVGVSILAYYDLRNRVEGLDLLRRLDTVRGSPGTH